MWARRATIQRSMQFLPATSASTSLAAISTIRLHVCISCGVAERIAMHKQPLHSKAQRSHLPWKVDHYDTMNHGIIPISC